MNSGSCLGVIAALGVLIGLQSCEFYRGKDFVKDGASQSDLRFLLLQRASIELTEDESVVNAYSDTGRDPTLWFEVSFDPNRTESLRAMLLRNGYVVRAEKPQIMPRVVPVGITQWWNPAMIDTSTLFALQKDREHPDTKGVWCFFDEAKGRILGSCFTY